MEPRAPVLMDKYEMGRLLGQGTFAKVYYGRSIQNGQSVAIKMIDKEKVLRVGLMDQIKREISVMGMVRHPNVVYLYEVMATKTKIYFVMEHAKGGELFDKLAKGRLKEDVAQMYFRQLISAVDFCHSRGVYHRDLKPENLLLDENENLKVSDFGLSALAETKRQDGLLHTTCGTPAYVAPEIISRKGYDGAKADIWSCGVILYVLLAGFLPFHDSNLMEMYRKIGKAEYKCPSWFPKDARRLLGKILDPNPDTRVTIAKIKESSWYKKDLSPKPIQSESDSINVNDVVSNGDPGPSRSSNANEESREEGIKPAELNAFDIISLSCGFDLSGLFEDCSHKKEARFTSREAASTIISKLMETAKSLRLKVRRMDKGLLNFEGTSEGRKGVLSIDAEIFEVTPALYLVEMRKANGDTFEYQKVIKEDIRPSLKDIVWAWQGEQQQQPLQLQQPLQNQEQS
ncbi:CBL-interacting protein kinase 2-like [Chenopodium quinoa]|uniref:non-specific serine/threonine protein kinase n=1 Tax=Chenopodium quinoa TaxID=63459 RepID=A0A803MW58_CHEQI|nr:CBL-interacting protein kinase 2-like [Chenopodium quinoa]